MNAFLSSVYSWMYRGVAACLALVGRAALLSNRCCIEWGILIRFHLGKGCGCLNFFFFKEKV